MSSASMTSLLVAVFATLRPLRLRLDRAPDTGREQRRVTCVVTGPSDLRLKRFLLRAPGRRSSCGPRSSFLVRDPGRRSSGDTPKGVLRRWQVRTGAERGPGRTIVGGVGMIEAVTSTTDLERGLLLRALRSPRGKYPAERAGQLSGVPFRTVYEWQARKIWVPDYAKANPMQWSYRDLVYLRMLLWLRQKGMERSEAAKRVRMVRHLIETEAIDTTVVRSEGQGLIIAGEDIDRMTGESVFAEVNRAVDEHDLLDPIPDVSTGPLWLPNLRRPSERTAVSPWVMAGEPCVRETRVPTVGLWVLQTQRALRSADIVRLYPGLTTEDVEDATTLERRLRLRAA